MARKKTINEWLNKARTIHGDKYDYKINEWGSFNNRLKVPIECPVHGVFHQSMSNHTHSKNPTGCPECSGVKQLSLSERIKQARTIHGDKYDYSKWPVEVNAKTRVSTKCKTCSHEWFHNVDNHVRGKGCPNCKTYESNCKKQKSKESRKIELIKKCENIINEKGRDSYSYHSLPMPFNMKTIYTFECVKHGSFITTPYNHFMKNSNCPECNNIELKNTFMLGFEKWVEVLKNIHPNYEFKAHEKGSNTAKDKICAICPEHGEWVVSIDSLKQSGCPACKGHSQTYLYINHVENGVLKFGIASDMDRRLNGQNKTNALKMKRLMYFSFKNHSDCRLCESEIKKSVEPVLTKQDLKDGWTETCSIKWLELIISMCKGFGGELNG